MIRDALISNAPDERVAVFVDLPPTESLPATPLLRQRGFHVVPVIQRWTVTPAVLRSELLLRDLVAYAPATPWPRSPSGVVFLLDGNRQGPRGRTDGSAAPQAQRPSPRRFDNRYAYPVCRFPPAAFLCAQGITAVRWISRVGIAPDMVPYAQRLDGAGLSPQSS